MPNTYLGLRQVVFRPVICRAQPQSEPGTARGTPSVTTTGLPLDVLNTRRAAIRRMVGGAAKDLLMRLSADRISPPLEQAFDQRIAPEQAERGRNRSNGQRHGAREHPIGSHPCDRPAQQPG